MSEERRFLYRKPLSLPHPCLHGVAFLVSRVAPRYHTTRKVRTSAGWCLGSGVGRVRGSYVDIYVDREN